MFGGTGHIGEACHFAHAPSCDAEIGTLLEKTADRFRICGSLESGSHHQCPHHSTPKPHRSRRAPRRPGASGGGPAASSRRPTPHSRSPSAGAHARHRRAGWRAGCGGGGRTQPAGLTGRRRPDARAAALGPRGPRRVPWPAGRGGGVGSGRWGRGRRCAHARPDRRRRHLARRAAGIAGLQAPGLVCTVLRRLLGAPSRTLNAGRDCQPS